MTSTRATHDAAAPMAEKASAAPDRSPECLGEARHTSRDSVNGLPSSRNLLIVSWSPNGLEFTIESERETLSPGAHISIQGTGR